jgi:hypothetical protein
MPIANANWLSAIERDGYVIVHKLLAVPTVATLLEAMDKYTRSGKTGVLERAGAVYGGRDLLWQSAAARGLAKSSEMIEVAEAVVGRGARPVRGLYFDKTEDANWNLPWHQDLTIAVRERRETPGFGPWTVKAGIPHATAPAELLARMVTIRVHLDDCGTQNGPMRVLPGSHASGRLSANAVNEWVMRSNDLGRDCLVPAGGAVVMRPLLLHASSLATVAGHRRVIHLEYTAEELPGGLEWCEPKAKLE